MEVLVDAGGGDEEDFIAALESGDEGGAVVPCSGADVDAVVAERLQLLFARVGRSCTDDLVAGDEVVV